MRHTRFLAVRTMSVRMFPALLLAGLATSASAGPGTWTTSGPEGGNVQFLVADPLAAQTLIAATQGGIFRSTDGAATWQRFENGVATDDEIVGF